MPRTDQNFTLAAELGSAASVNAAIKAAEEGGPTPDEDLITDVYAEVPDALREQLREALDARRS